MALIYKATNLDPQNVAIDGDNVYRFSWENNGSAQTGYQVLIYNNDTGVELDDSGVVTSSNQYYDVVGSTLANNLDCKWYVTTYSGLDDAASDYEFFKTRTTPTATFTDPVFSATPIPISTQDYDFIVEYGQAESVAIKRFKFTLYDADGVDEISTSDWVYSFSPEWTFSGMVNNTYYQIECLVESQDALEGTTDKQDFYVSYTRPANTPAISIIPNNSDGSMYISWGNLKQSEGTVAGGTYSYVNRFGEKAIYLEQASTELTYEESFNDAIYTFTFYCQLSYATFLTDEIFMEFNEGNKKLGYDVILETFYYEDNSIKTYADYATLPAVFTGEWMFFGITCDDIIIKKDGLKRAHIDIN